MALPKFNWGDPWSKITLGVLLLALFTILYRTRLAEHATVSWDVPVSGRVVEVDAWAHGIRGGVQLVFEYELEDGRSGRGIWNPGGERTGAQEALSFRESYAVGSRVSGWANPDQPTEAVVKRGPAITKPRMVAVWFGGAALLFVLGVVQAVWRARARRRVRAANQAAFDAAMGEIRAHKSAVGRVRVRHRVR